MLKSTLVGEGKIIRVPLITNLPTTCVGIRLVRVLFSNFRLWIPFTPNLKLEDDGIPIRWRLALCLRHELVTCIEVRNKGVLKGKVDIRGRNSNLLGSIANGMSPSRCARTSSCMTDVLFST